MRLELLKQHLETLRGNLLVRHQTVPSIAINAIALVAIVSLLPIQSNLVKVFIVLLLCLLLAVTWYDICEIRCAIHKVQLHIDKVTESEGLVSEIAGKAPWYSQNFQEVIGGIFTLIVLFLFYLVICYN
ncbi:hypothetical protein KKF59_04445 [Patescibacteria group bacterium]|nr:hypothetical protein [Patescibacteria group bacterium]MBU1908344.1 hypothetical protein [Patescibacteria group bacterium]